MLPVEVLRSGLCLAMWHIRQLLPVECLRTLTLEQQVFISQLLLPHAGLISISAQRFGALKSRKRQLWLEWAEPVSLTAVLCAGTKPISFRISPSQSLGLCKQLPESRKFVIPHWACGTVMANWVFPVLQMKRQHLCQGCSSVLGRLCLVTTAGS